MVEQAPLRVLVYSDNPRTREQVQLALGKRVHPDLPELTYVEIATGPMAVRQMDEGGFDLVIVNGEAAPVWGMGIAKQLKDEIADCPPILVLTGRPDDRWLANWSRAEAAVPHPIDPLPIGQGNRKTAKGRDRRLPADPRADRTAGRPLAGQLVARGSRCPPPDRPD